MPSTYSIRFSHEGNSNLLALDWSFFKKCEWSASEKEGERWFPHSETDEKMHEVLLNHFGLSQWKDEYLWDAVKHLSPQLLAAERRGKEMVSPELPRKEMRSDTLGYHAKAEEHHD